MTINQKAYVLEEDFEYLQASQKLSVFDEIMHLSLKQGLSGATLLAFIDGKIIWKKAYGYKNQWNKNQPLASPEPTTTDTLYDLASLTKIYATLMASMKLFDTRELQPDHLVSYYLPEFAGEEDKKNVTVRMLMQHRSGLPGSYYFYDPQRSGPFYSQDRQTTMTFLPQVPLAYKPDTKTLYSDIGVCLLGHIIEKIVGCQQDTFLETMLYRKLDLTSTAYRLKDKKKIPANAFAATERCGNTRDGHITFPNIRTETIQGEVQDETVFYALGEVGASAGLFSCVDDLVILSQMILNGGSYKDLVWCSPDTVAHFIHTKSPDRSYSLLWQNTEHQNLIAGLIPKPNAVCHTGWLGNITLIDYSVNAGLIYLSNKKNSPVLALPNLFRADCAISSTYGRLMDSFYLFLIDEKKYKPLEYLIHAAR